MRTLAQAKRVKLCSLGWIDFELGETGYSSEYGASLMSLIHE